MDAVDVFISYAREDHEVAEALAGLITAKGWQVWWDQERLSGGVTFPAAIGEALASTKSVVVIWSQHSVVSEWVAREAHEGLEHNLLVPVAIETEVDIPWEHKNLHTEDLSQWDRSADHPAFEKLLKAIRHKIGKPAKPPAHVLTHRLESLKRNLERMNQVQDYMQDIRRLLTDPSMASLWDEILENAEKHINAYTIRVDEILNSLPDGYQTQEAWQDYKTLLRNCEGLFYETTDFLTGLVFRNALLPHTQEMSTSKVYQIADEMVKRAALITEKSFRAAFPAHPDRVTRTLLNLVRLRFPGWSIWHLPLLAYEYGRLLIRQDNDIQNFLNDHLRRLNEDDAPDLVPRSLDYWEELFADVFATYYVGPAYAYVMTYLRFNPLAGEEKNHDFDRAEAVFRTLDRMGRDAAPGVDMHPYREVLDGLSDDWNAAVRNANQPAVEIPREKRRAVKEFCTQCLRQFRGYYNPELGYPVEQKYQGWKLAKSWAEDWDRQLREPGRGAELDVPDGLSLLNTLRDGLNAGWICRMRNRQEVARLAKVMVETCFEIMERDPAAGIAARP